MADLYEWVIGGLLVLLYAHGRFHTPKTNLGSTTLFRYYSTAGLYYGATLLLFVFLSTIAASSPQIFGALQLGGAESIPGSLKGVTSPTMAALLMTALLPNFPILREIDAWLLKLFRDLGNIPLEVRSWRDRLARSELQIPPSARDALRRKAVSDPRLASIAEADLQFEPDDTPRYQFTRVVYLMCVLENFSTAQRRYPRVLEDFAEEYASIKARFEQTAAVAGRCFAVVDKHAQEPAATGALVELRRGFRERCDALYSDMCQLLARGILLNEASQHDRKRKLRGLGYSYVDERSAALDINQVLTVASITGLILFAVISIAGHGESPQSVMFISIMVAAIYGCAVICALSPKLAWRFADITQTGERPVAAYLLSGVLSVGCGVIVQVLFKSLWFFSFWKALMSLGTSYPWLLMTFSVTVGLAFLADNWGGRIENEPRWARAAESLALGIVLAVAFLLVQRMLEEIGQPIPANRMAASIVIGMFLGAAVPHWFRATRTENTSRGGADVQGEPGSMPGRLA